MKMQCDSVLFYFLFILFSLSLFLCNLCQNIMIQSLSSLLIRIQQADWMHGYCGNWSSKTLWQLTNMVCDSKEGVQCKYTLDKYAILPLTKQCVYKCAWAYEEAVNIFYFPLSNCFYTFEAQKYSYFVWTKRQLKRKQNLFTGVWYGCVHVRSQNVFDTRKFTESIESKWEKKTRMYV